MYCAHILDITLRQTHGVLSSHLPTRSPPQYTYPTYPPFSSVAPSKASLPLRPKRASQRELH